MNMPVQVYKLVRKTTGTLGGNGYDGAIYGELTMHSMHKIVNILMSKCEVGNFSRPPNKLCLVSTTSFHPHNQTYAHALDDIRLSFY